MVECSDGVERLESVFISRLATLGPGRARLRRRGAQPGWGRTGTLKGAKQAVSRLCGPQSARRVASPTQ